MDLIHKYIFGSAIKIKEFEGVKKRLIKEASGDKSFNTLEIVARIILFKLSLSLSVTDDPNKNEKGVASAAHKIVLLLLKRPPEPYIHTSTIGKERSVWT